MTETKSQPFDNLSDEHALALEKAYQSAFNMSMAIMPPASPDRWHRAWREALIATLNKAAELGIIAAPRPVVSTSDIAAELESVVWRLVNRYRDQVDDELLNGAPDARPTEQMVGDEPVPDDVVPLQNVRYRSSPDQPGLELIATVPDEYGPAVRAQLHGAPGGVSIGYESKAADSKPDDRPPDDDREIVVLECTVKELGKWPEEFRATCEVSIGVFEHAALDSSPDRKLVMNQLKGLRAQSLTERGYESPIIENERWGHFSPTASLAKQVPKLLDW